MDDRGMRRALVACALIVALQPVAAAAQPKHDGLRQCFGKDISMEEMEMDCVEIGGEWEPVGGPGGGPGGLFGTFLFFGLVLMLLPGFVGVSVGKAAGVTPLVGFLIGLFGSWIGVIILYLGGQSQRGSPVITIGSPTPRDPAAGMGPAVGATRPGPPAEPAAAPDSGGAAERLKTLKDLLDQGLITQEEYDARRAAAIESL